jgi:hypothetical protein
MNLGLPRGIPIAPVTQIAINIDTTDLFGFNLISIF